MIEITLAALIVISLTFCAILSSNEKFSFWSNGLTLFFLTLSLVCLTWALIRIRNLIKNHPVFKLSNKSMYLHWLCLTMSQLLCITLFIVQIAISKRPDSVKDQPYLTLMLSELICVADFIVLTFYAIIIYKFSVYDLRDQEKPLALLSSKLR